MLRGGQTVFRGISYFKARSLGTLAGAVSSRPLQSSIPIVQQSQQFPMQSGLDGFSVPRSPLFGTVSSTLFAQPVAPLWWHSDSDSSQEPCERELVPTRSSLFHTLPLGSPLQRPMVYAPAPSHVTSTTRIEKNTPASEREQQSEFVDDDNDDHAHAPLFLPSVSVSVTPSLLTSEQKLDLVRERSDILLCAVPKKKTSVMKRRVRRAGQRNMKKKWVWQPYRICMTCGNPVRLHHLCLVCFKNSPAGKYWKKDENTFVDLRDHKDKRKYRSSYKMDEKKKKERRAVLRELREMEKGLRAPGSLTAPSLNPRLPFVRENTAGVRNEPDKPKPPRHGKSGAAKWSRKMARLRLLRAAAEEQQQQPKQQRSSSAKS